MGWHVKPEGFHEKLGPAGRGRRDGAGVCDRHGRNGLHRLDRHRNPTVRARDHGEQAEAQQHPLGVEASDRDVPDDERD